MALKIRRGTEEQRTGITFAPGEVVWTTNSHRLYVGDGVTAGGINVASQLSGNGIAFNATTNRLDINLGSTTADTLPEGATNQYFTPVRAVSAVSTALTNGNSYNTGITFLYDDVHNRITATVTASGGTTLPSQTGHPNQFLKTDGSGALSWATPAAGITAISQDTNPSLGGDLTLSGHAIGGTGSISYTGNFTATYNTSKFGFSSLQNNAFDLTSITNGQLNGAGGIGINAAKGTISSPTTTAAGDILGAFVIRGWNGTSYLPGISIGANWDSTANLTTAFPASKFGVFVGTNTSTPTAFYFNYQGILNAPVVQSGVYSTGGTALPAASAVGVGARAFVTDATATTFASSYTGGGSNKVPVYSDGSVWRIG